MVEFTAGFTVKRFFNSAELYCGKTKVALEKREENLFSLVVRDSEGDLAGIKMGTTALKQVLESFQGVFNSDPVPVSFEEALKEMKSRGAKFRFNKGTVQGQTVYSWNGDRLMGKHPKMAFAEVTELTQSMLGNDSWEEVADDV